MQIYTPKSELKNYPLGYKNDFKLSTLYAIINRINKLILFDWIMHEKVHATMQDRSCI